MSESRKKCIFLFFCLMGDEVCFSLLLFCRLCEDMKEKKEQAIYRQNGKRRQIEKFLGRQRQRVLVQDVCTRVEKCTKIHLNVCFMQFYRKRICCINYLLYLCSARCATVVARLRGLLVPKPSLIGAAGFQKAHGAYHTCYKHNRGYATFGNKEGRH